MPLNSIEESITTVERVGGDTDRENKMSHEQSSVLLKLMLKGPSFFIVLVSLAARMMKKVPSSQKNTPPPE